MSSRCAIVGAMLIDGTGGAPKRDSVIVFDGPLIAAVGGPGLEIPPDAEVVHAQGKYVIPGLMDANVHLFLEASPFNTLRFDGRFHELAVEAAQLTLRSGVTTVFDTWGPREDLIRARDLINAGKEVGSRIFLAGNIVGLSGPMSEDFWQASNIPDSYRNAINERWEQGVGSPGSVPSTMTRLRSMPRRWMFGVLISTPAGWAGSPVPFSW